jgi:hypothetical protein
MRHSEYNQKLQTLSQNLQDFINSEDLEASLADLTLDIDLENSKRPILTEEILYVLATIEPKANLIDNLKHYVGVDDATAQNIAALAEEEIFTPAEELNLPAMPKAEQDVVVKKIFSNNEILNRQLEGGKDVPMPQEAKIRPSIEPQFYDSSITKPISQPQPQPLMRKPGGPSIVDARLGGSFNLPKENLDVSKPAPQPNQPPQPPTKDPYREPIE